MKTNAFDRTVLSLCNEVDNLTAEVEYWHSKYDELQREYSEYLNQSLISARRDVGNMLTFALVAREGADGSLIIDRESRDIMVDRLKEEV